MESSVDVVTKSSDELLLKDLESYITVACDNWWLGYVLTKNENYKLNVTFLHTAGPLPLFHIQNARRPMDIY